LKLNIDMAHHVQVNIDPEESTWVIYMPAKGL
jgi:hypothetical protein